MISWQSRQGRQKRSLKNKIKDFKTDEQRDQRETQS